MRRRKHGIAWIGVLTGLCALALSARSAETLKRPRPDEPTVSPAEAALLGEVVELGSTNRVQAIDRLKRADLKKASPALDFVLGNLLFQADRLEEAAQSYQAALEKSPGFVRASVNLGRVLLLQDRPDAAVAIYRDLVTAGLANADAYLLLGHALLQEDAPGSAETAYRQALLLQPDSNDARRGLAKCLLVQERYREALAMVKELLSDDLRNGELWGIRANALIALDKPDAALRALEAARRLGCSNATATATLGDLYLNADMPAEAVKRYREALTQGDVSVSRMVRVLDGLVALEQLREATNLLPDVEAKVAKADPPAQPELTASLTRIRARIAQLEGRADDALRLYESMVRTNPLDGKGLLLLGDLHREQGRLEDAVMAYERAATLSGFEAEALVRQAQTEVERERYKRAVELLESAVVFRDEPSLRRYLEQVRRLAQ